MRFNTITSVVLAVVSVAAVSVTTLHSQPVQILTMPRAQSMSQGVTLYEVTPTVTGSFNASINLRASSPTLPGATFRFTPPILNFPYNKTSVLSVDVIGAHAGGDHQIIVEAYNGPITTSDTVTISITERPSWRTFDVYNSPLPSNRVNAIAVDDNGVGWIATDSGLARFDGINWTIYTEQFRDPLLEYFEPRVTNVITDRTGNVWVNAFSQIHKLTDTTWFHKRLHGMNFARGLGDTVLCIRE